MPVASPIIFRARQFEFRFPRPMVIMGIVNVTPDSFSDGGKFLDEEAAVAHALELVAQGAEILDIGGESTRPGAQPVPEDEELRRVMPVIERLAEIFMNRGTTVPAPAPTGGGPGTSVTGRAQGPVISIDTMKPAVARAALAAGASIVNDVAAGRSDDRMWRLVSEYQAGYVVMHGLSAASPPPRPAGDILRAVGEFFSERLSTLLNESGIAAEQVLLDPGIGFGKTQEQNLQLLAGLRSFTKWRRPLLLGVSRKSFIEKLTGAKLNDRLPASLACAILAVKAGVNLIRVHDVAETAQAVRMAEAILQKSNVD